MIKEQTVWYKVNCKWCKGRFIGNRVIPIEEPLHEFSAKIKGTNHSTLGQIQYLLCQEICKTEKISPVYVCDMRLLDKQIEYTSEYMQTSIFERSAYA
jgi:hypothetical protein